MMEVDMAKEIGPQIRERRLELNMTQDMLAKELNVSRSAVSNWEIILWRNKEMELRKYQSSDCKEVTELFYNTVHIINAKDYTKEQA